MSENEGEFPAEEQSAEQSTEGSPNGERATQLSSRVEEAALRGNDTEGMDRHLDRIAKDDLKAPEYMTNSYLNSVEANLDRVDGEQEARRAGELEEKVQNDEEAAERAARDAEERKHQELGHEVYTGRSGEEERKAIRGERAKSELSKLPITEITPVMVEAVKAAVERGIAPIDMPEELAILAGVRIDDVGTFDARMTDPSPEDYADNTPAERQQQEYMESFYQGKLVDRVGTFTETNNGMMSYTDHMGRIFTAPSNNVLYTALKQAGYDQKSGYVYCSNGDMPANAERLTDLCVARELEDRLGVIQGLQELGIDKSEEHSALVEEIRANIAGSNRGMHLESWRRTLGMVLDPTTIPPKPEPAPVQHSELGVL